MKVFFLFILTAFVFDQLWSQENEQIIKSEIYFIESFDSVKIFNDSIIIILESGFDEDVVIVYAEKILFSGKINSYKSTGSTLKNLVLKNNNCENNSLSIKLIDSNKYLDMIVDFRYKFLAIHCDENKWTLIYRNTPIIYE